MSAAPTAPTRKSRTIAEISPDRCTGCEACMAVMPHDDCIVKVSNDITLPTTLIVCEVNVDRCTGCTLCLKICPWDAIAMVPRVSGSAAPGVGSSATDRPGAVSPSPVKI
ncbi:MAG: 4Fe-4S binding protein [Elusimicrobia bacterium]|nr:4Fe-4S binding protein [Elusimicrobiota bacterium]